MFIFVFLLLLFIIELLYFRIADHYNIIDHPNHRSSHTKVTIRGGGIIFPLAAVGVSIYTGAYYWFAIGLSVISIISFVDDLDHVRSILRSGVQFASVALLLVELNPAISLYWYLLVFILIIGTINAWNFMDGINGITGAYSLVTVGTLFYIQQYSHSFTNSYLLLAVLAALLTFNFFNFRKRAKCFAGDVGSVSMAFIICFLLIQLVISTANFAYIGFSLIYGLDTITTILLRIMRKENIFQPHRTHLYQFLANEKGWPHLVVAGLYSVIQGLLNIGLIAWMQRQSYISSYGIVPLFWVCLIGGFLFVGIRWYVESVERQESNRATEDY